MVRCKIPQFSRFSTFGYRGLKRTIYDHQCQSGAHLDVHISIEHMCVSFSAIYKKYFFFKCGGGREYSAKSNDYRHINTFLSV